MKLDYAAEGCNESWTAYRKQTTSVASRLRVLANDPRPQGCEKLYDDIYRVRVGDIRIIYLIDEGNKRIEMGGIRRRSERTYNGIEGLFR